MADTDALRIFHVIRSPVGGIFRHVADLIREQSNAGHSCGMICDLSGGVFEDDAIAALQPMLPLGVVRVPMTRQITMGDARALRDVYGVLASKSPDVIHTHGSKGGVFGRVVAAWLGRKRPVARFYVPHGGSLQYDPKTLKGAFYFRVERALERITDALIHVSAYEAQSYLDKVGTPRCDAFVIRNGVTPEEFEPIVMAPDATDFLFFGNLRPVKGVDVMIDALAMLKARGEPATATIVGDGPELPHCQALAAERGLGDSIRFIPSKPAREALTYGRIVVMPTRFESMPYVVLETVAAGRPLISTNVGGIPEIYGPFSDELLQPDDPLALANAMAEAKSDPETAAAKAEARRAHITKEFSVAEMADRVESVYRDAIKRRKRRD